MMSEEANFAVSDYNDTYIIHMELCITDNKLLLIYNLTNSQF